MDKWFSQKVSRIDINGFANRLANFILSFSSKVTYFHTKLIISLGYSRRASLMTRIQKIDISMRGMNTVRLLC